jgi:phenylacetate-coenzyme A ligase PaaK-like adenylate-forming protein
VGVVLDSVLAARARQGACAVITTPSAATRLAAHAADRKIGLSNIDFFVGSEPLTSGKAEEITNTGARVWDRYAMTETGAVGIACARPTAIDDMHFLADSFGLILSPRTLPDGAAVNALVFTTLLSSSSKILLNVESDDFGEVTTRRCGCIWDTLGMHTHLAAVRSFSKLTGEGVTVLGTDFLRILEEVLPREFGGRSIDYQLLEAEDADHLTRLYLVVSPAVGPIDEARMQARFMEELRDPRRDRSLMPPLWRQAETLRVVRRDPVPTARGKLLPFHTQALTTQGQERP